MTNPDKTVGGQAEAAVATAAEAVDKVAEIPAVNFETAKTEEQKAKQRADSLQKALAFYKAVGIDVADGSDWAEALGRAVDEFLELGKPEQGRRRDLAIEWLGKNPGVDALTPEFAIHVVALTNTKLTTRQKGVYESWLTNNARSTADTTVPTAKPDVPASSGAPAVEAAVDPAASAAGEGEGGKVVAEAEVAAEVVIQVPLTPAPPEAPADESASPAPAQPEASVTPADGLTDDERARIAELVSGGKHEDFVALKKIALGRDDESRAFSLAALESLVDNQLWIRVWDVVTYSKHEEVRRVALQALATNKCWRMIFNEPYLTEYPEDIPLIAPAFLDAFKDGLTPDDAEKMIFYGESEEVFSKFLAALNQYLVDDLHLEPFKFEYTKTATWGDLYKALTKQVWSKLPAAEGSEEVRQPQPAAQEDVEAAAAAEAAVVEVVSADKAGQAVDGAEVKGEAATSAPSSLAQPEASVTPADGLTDNERARIAELVSGGKHEDFVALKKIALGRDDESRAFSLAALKPLLDNYRWGRVANVVTYSKHEEVRRVALQALATNKHWWTIIVEPYLTEYPEDIPIIVAAFLDAFKDSLTQDEAEVVISDYVSEEVFSKFLAALNQYLADNLHLEPFKFEYTETATWGDLHNALMDQVWSKMPAAEGSEEVRQPQPAAQEDVEAAAAAEAAVVEVVSADKAGQAVDGAEVKEEAATSAPSSPAQPEASVTPADGLTDDERARIAELVSGGKHEDVVALKKIALGRGDESRAFSLAALESLVDNQLWIRVVGVATFSRHEEVRRAALLALVANQCWGQIINTPYYTGYPEDIPIIAAVFLDAFKDSLTQDEAEKVIFGHVSEYEFSKFLIALNQYLADNLHLEPFKFEYTKTATWGDLHNALRDQVWNKMPAAGEAEPVVTFNAKAEAQRLAEEVFPANKKPEEIRVDDIAQIVRVAYRGVVDEADLEGFVNAFAEKFWVSGKSGEWTNLLYQSELVEETDLINPYSYLVTLVIGRAEHSLAPNAEWKTGHDRLNALLIELHAILSQRQISVEDLPVVAEDETQGRKIEPESAGEAEETSPTHSLPLLQRAKAPLLNHLSPQWAKFSAKGREFGSGVHAATNKLTDFVRANLDFGAINNLVDAGAIEQARKYQGEQVSWRAKVANVKNSFGQRSAGVTISKHYDDAEDGGIETTTSLTPLGEKAARAVSQAKALGEKVGSGVEVGLNYARGWAGGEQAGSKFQAMLDIGKMLDDPEKFKLDSSEGQSNAWAAVERSFVEIAQTPADQVETVVQQVAAQFSALMDHGVLPPIPEGGAGLEFSDTFGNLQRFYTDNKGKDVQEVSAEEARRVLFEFWASIKDAPLPDDEDDEVVIAEIEKYNNLLAFAVGHWAQAGWLRQDKE